MDPPTHPPPMQRALLLPHITSLVSSCVLSKSYCRVSTSTLMSMRAKSASCIVPRESDSYAQHFSMSSKSATGGSVSSLWLIQRPAELARRVAACEERS